MAPIYPAQRSFPLGTSGGTGGFFFEDHPEAGAEIAKIYVNFGDYIDGLRIEWADGTDAYHGSCNGPAIAEFDVHHQNGEKLRGFDGSTGAHPGDGGPYVTSIRFHTETRSPEVFGKQSSNSTFRCPSVTKRIFRIGAIPPAVFRTFMSSSRPHNHPHITIAEAPACI